MAMEAAIMLAQLLDVVRILFYPEDVFTNIKLHPHWLLAFIIISIISFGVAWQLVPFTQKLLYIQLSAQVGQEKAMQVVNMSRSVQYFSLFFVSIPILMKWLVITMGLYYSAILWGEGVAEFKTFFSVVAHSEFIWICMAIINVLLLQIKGVDSVYSLSDLQSIIGLDYFLTDRSQNVVLFTFLNNFNVFSLWYLATLTFGISIVSELNIWKSFFIVAFVSILAIAIQLSISSLTQGIQQNVGHG